jgi:hypothetical protein
MGAGHCPADSGHNIPLTNQVAQAFLPALRVRRGDPKSGRRKILFRAGPVLPTFAPVAATPPTTGHNFDKGKSHATATTFAPRAIQTPRRRVKSQIGRSRRHTKPRSGVFTKRTQRRRDSPDSKRVARWLCTPKIRVCARPPGRSPRIHAHPVSRAENGPPSRSARPTAARPKSRPPFPPHLEY